MKQFLNSLVAYFVPLLAIMLLAFAVMNAITAMNGTQYCRESIASELPSQLNNFYEKDATYARTYLNHWSVAILYRSKDHDNKMTTVVCHFHGASYDFDEYKKYEEDRLDEYLQSSSSNLSPVNWF